MANFGKRKNGQAYPKRGYRGESHVTMYNKTYAQTGRSNTAADRGLGAKLPGYRRSAKGSKYFERRKNRSDKRGSRI